MNVQDFEDQLRKRLRHEPFEPFVVLVDDGRSIFVDRPTIAFDGGRAGFIGPDDFVEIFDCEQVIGFQPVSREMTP